MNVFNVDKLEIVANKINYLIQKIKNDPAESKKLEVKLLKKYTQDFYDLLIENDFANYYPESNISVSDPLDSQKALIQSFLFNSGLPIHSEPTEHPTWPSSFSSPDKGEKIDIDLNSEAKPDLVNQALSSGTTMDSSTPEVLPLPLGTLERVATSNIYPSKEAENLIIPVEPALIMEKTIPEEPVILLSPELIEKVAKYKEEIIPVNETDLSSFNKLFDEKTESQTIEESSTPIIIPKLPADVGITEKLSLHQPFMDDLDTQEKQLVLDAENDPYTPSSLLSTSVSFTQENTKHPASDEIWKSDAPKERTANENVQIDLPNMDSEDLNKTMVIPIETIQEINAAAEETQPPPALPEEIIAKLEERRKALESLQATIKQNENAKPEEPKRDIFISFEKIEGDTIMPQDVERDINKTEVINISPFSDVEKKLETEEMEMEQGDKVPQKLSINDILAQNKEDTELADMLSRGINERSFDISFNQRFAYINELFGGSQSIYEETLKSLATCSTVIEAYTYLNLYVRNKFNWKDNDPTTKEFLATVRKKFQPNYA